MDRNLRLSTHFTLGEMIKSSTAARKGIDNTPPEALIPKLTLLCTKILEPIRQHYGIPFAPNSGYRSEMLNSAIGGSSNSQHCKGEAVDVEIPGVSNDELALWIKDNLEFDQLILECYQSGEPGSGWVHVSLKQDASDNRSQVLTYSNRQYLQGLVR